MEVITTRHGEGKLATKVFVSSEEGGVKSWQNIARFVRKALCQATRLATQTAAQEHTGHLTFRRLELLLMAHPSRFVFAHVAFVPVR